MAYFNWKGYIYDIAIFAAELRALCKEFHDRIYQIESAKFDLEKEVEFRDYQINELNIAVNDMKGKL